MKTAWRSLVYCCFLDFICVLFSVYKLAFIYCLRPKFVLNQNPCPPQSSWGCISSDFIQVLVVSNDIVCCLSLPFLLLQWLPLFLRRFPSRSGALWFNLFGWNRVLPWVSEVALTAWHRTVHGLVSVLS